MRFAEFEDEGIVNSRIDRGSYSQFVLLPQVVPFPCIDSAGPCIQLRSDAAEIVVPVMRIRKQPIPELPFLGPKP